MDLKNLDGLTYHELILRRLDITDDLLDYELGREAEGNYRENLLALADIAQYMAKRFTDEFEGLDDKFFKAWSLGGENE